MTVGEHIETADQAQRWAILNDLDSTMLVEAAAGTGKTTSMVGRMVNLLAAGMCSIDAMAAVTFTRKAAAELRSRFQIELERAHRDSVSPGRERLASALSGLEGCFIGTIHSLCGRILRERPVEAGVDMDFQEMDDAEDSVLRMQAWREYVSSLYASAHPILDELELLGVEIGQLGPAFLRLADFPDVDDWPATAAPLPDLEPARMALANLVQHMEQLAPSLPEDPGNDTLMPRYRLVPLLARQANRGNTVAHFMEMLAEFKTVKIVQKNWPGKAAQAKDEHKLWDDFRTSFAEPLVKAWRVHRYEPLLRAVRPALQEYDDLRAREGKLSYQDLLMKTASLLRNKSNRKVREHFRKRFSHLLVDEFQDTDPVQAEVIMLLTSQDSTETEWHRCAPVPGSLFVVGDPKQSIYRFRRADIVTYNQVKEIIRRSHGKIVHLSSNFRTTPRLADWVNGAFQSEFDQLPSECSPRYVNLDAALKDEPDVELSGLSSIVIPKECRIKADIVEHDADMVARTVRKALDAGYRVVRRNPEDPAAARPEDFLIVTRNKENLGSYSRKLQEYGVPHQVTGGKALNQVRELKLLHSCLTALTRPDDPVALVAVLRGELFGISDSDLFAFKKAGGIFSFNSPVPEVLSASVARPFADAFDRFRKYSRWLRALPVVSAVERIAGDLGLSARAASGRGGDILAGSLAKAIELLRAVEKESWTPAQIAEYFGRLVEEDESHDSISARASGESVTRLMNLHKVKGLEAPVVFLSDPTGYTKRTPEMYVDRSGDRVLGYLAIYGSDKGSYRKILLAQPQGWDDFAASEARFRDAEELRLLYVAATRAGCGLTVSLKSAHKTRSPWSFFESRLQDAVQLEDPGSPIHEAAAGSPVSEVSAVHAAAEISSRWSDSTVKTYDVVSAKALSVRKGRTIMSSGEHGTEWGSILHVLMETAMVDGDADLRDLARAALSEHGLSADLVDDAIEEVQAVMQSEIWQRARNASRRLVEVPYQRIARNVEGSDERPIVVRGMIDLAFLEPAGWVIVDYKSDRISAENVPLLVESYGPQVLDYAEAWTEITGEDVHEAGLYFTHVREYVPVTSHAGGWSRR